ncbi:MAG: hypothetical protein M3Q14_04630 [bacterium]|nr:hypothetical protein [bacterium]
MKRKFTNNAIIGLMVVMPFIAAPPKKAEAAASSNFAQTILPPSCYDVVNSTGPTVDYIATFECEYRTPDGNIYISTQQQ